ncbi:hypothetical protein A3767_01295 [Oleiphilus sp. HI0133]|nr:hypothetical protein A3767_20900 [Oleiphilus sp. HI0133]KZZ78845.1 hypothetical protein A3767_01295 [Oleiphilus sp. HI0133]
MKKIKPDMALVKRLLIKLHPEFFALTEQEQNRIRQRLYLDHTEQVDTYLYKELFGLRYDPTIGEDQLNSLQLNRFNAHTTALCGIGKNSLKLNELHGGDFDLTQFPTLRDYDVHEFNFQQDARKKHSSATFAERPYRLYLHHVWARIIDDQSAFWYLTLSSLSFYLLDALENPKRDLVDELIPNELVEGENHGKSESGGFVWDWKCNAYGKERELEELQDRVREYQSTRYHVLNDEFHDQQVSIYMIERDDDPDEASMSIVVNNASAAAKVRFTHFLTDCAALSKNASEIEELKQREIELQEAFIREQYQDICDNFDPKVVKLKKKYKVVFSSKALDDLDQILSDETDEEDNNDPKN